MSDYEVTFTALAEGGELQDDAVGRLSAALGSMPGLGALVGVEGDPAGPRVSATFWIAVRLGMADAARDGSRLAKEALKSAGMGGAQLVELRVRMEAPAAGTAPREGGDVRS